MNEVVEELLEDYHDLIVFKDIQLHKQDNGVLKVMANKELMSILVANLLSNAIKYNVQQGSLDIFIESDSLRILNTSTEGALNPDYIFERFYKGKQDSNSNGLGLSIVKSILENYPQFLLEYTYTMDKHQFSLVKREK
ncbi:sensor histidine kinase [Sphingobacterium sp. T2]|nr:HAMP domain-containing sensor histidine kinase [Sphingobacterium sp. T2]